MESALDAHDVSAKQSRVKAADHERIKETAVISIARNAANARMFSQMFFIAATSCFGVPRAFSDPSVYSCIIAQRPPVVKFTILKGTFCVFDSIQKSDDILSRK